jgi:hypothetical protein
MSSVQYDILYSVSNRKRYSVPRIFRGEGGGGTACVWGCQHHCHLWADTLESVGAFMAVIAINLLFKTSYISNLPHMPYKWNYPEISTSIDSYRETSIVLIQLKANDKLIMAYLKSIQKDLGDWSQTLDLLHGLPVLSTSNTCADRFLSVLVFTSCQQSMLEYS